MQMLAIRKPNMCKKSLTLPSEMADNELLIGPFTQLVSMRSLPEKGPLSDNQLHIIKDAGILINHGSIQECGSFLKMRKQATDVYELDGAVVALPGMIDPHTHICFAGSRAGDYALRLAGKDYLEIARAGGGIWQTVQSTRQAPPDELAGLTLRRADILLNRGCTTVEVKSGYGLSLLEELKILRAIKAAAQQTPIDVVSSCLAAHVVPHDFIGSSKEYLKFVVQDLLPTVRSEKLASRVDIFVEHGAFGKEEALHFLHEAKAMGFGLTVHGDQFHVGGSAVAINARALSVDHLEASTDVEIQALAKSDVVATVLPGASIGLGVPFAPARKLLDAGNCLAIGSDWNPGSAPMGDLLLQAALLGASENLTNAETLAGITCRAAKALNLHDRGVLESKKIADIIAFPCDDYREIIYNQGKLTPHLVVKKGQIKHV
jgi:imidazolonepropionase